ncbi:unnamed protein product [Effrenium voratum]|nr:unnamed protein product [Effrenium voratum]
MELTPASPRLPPASPALTTFSDPEITDWWCIDNLPADSPFHVAVQEMRRYFADWTAASRDPFWQRKSGKTVLSVLLCHNSDGWRCFRGMNTEVSLPAGSFCAERAAITRAASDLCPARNFTMIATLDPCEKMNPLWPCEVCQSWLSKLRQESASMVVIAFESIECQQFAVRGIGGELLEPPHQPPSPNEAISGSPWPDLLELAEGTTEYPWDCKEVVYVDGAWNFLHAGHLRILKEAKARGSHVLVGVHSDQTLNEVFGMKSHEDFETRLGRIVQNRHVSFVLKDAPWIVPKDLITTLCIKKVLSGSVSKLTDGGKVMDEDLDPYKTPKDLGMFEVIESVDTITEEMHANTTKRSVESRPAPC